VLVERKANLVLAPTSDATLRGLADSITPVQGVIDSNHLERTGLSSDVEISLSGDLFAQMRAVFLVQRMLASKRWADAGAAPAPMQVRDVLKMATVGGANANGLLDRIGTLTPGKEADLVLLRARDPNIGPLNNAAATVVVAATPDTVDTVIIGGQIRKRRGALVRTDVAKILRDAELSIVLVSDGEMQRLNRRWRRKDRPTDVLSFPLDAGGLLGDVVISVDTARRQAAEQGTTLGREADRLLIHGLLHLLGYDHERSPAAARRMQRRERALARWL